MMDRPEAAGVTVDWDIVRWVGEHHRGAFLAHQRGEVGGIESVAAQDPMTTEELPPPTLPTK